MGIDISLIDFGSHQVFNQKSTYTCIVFIQKKQVESIKYEKINPKDINTKREYNQIEYKLLDSHKGWFGRMQAISDYGEKLFFPYMSSQAYFVYCNQKDLLFYAGYAIFLDSQSKKEIDLLKIILTSKVFWYYIQNASKPYSGNFYALAKNYVKDFGVCELTKEEENFLLKSNSQNQKDKFLLNKYKLSIG